MNLIKDQDAYLFAFFDAVTDYLQSNSSELDGFIRYWDETLCSKNNSEWRSRRYPDFLHTQIQRIGIPYRTPSFLRLEAGE